MEAESSECALCRPRLLTPVIRVHLHVIPRYATGRRCAGVDFADPDWPGHYHPGAEYIAPAEVVAVIAAALD